MKDRHKRELELKKLAKQIEQHNTTSTDNGDATTAPDQVDSRANDNKENISTVISMDIDDIPIPETDPGKLNDIFLPDSKASSSSSSLKMDESKNGVSMDDEPKTPTTPPLPNNAPLRPPQGVLVSVVPSMKPLSPPGVVLTDRMPLEPNKTKPKNVTKLPLPPGMNQEELEAIESPPSRSPSPLPVVAKPKTPPRKSIKDLPMPPGEIIIDYVVSWLLHIRELFVLQNQDNLLYNLSSN